MQKQMIKQQKEALCIGGPYDGEMWPVDFRLKHGEVRMLYRPKLEDFSVSYKEGPATVKVEQQAYRMEVFNFSATSQVYLLVWNNLHIETAFQILLEGYAHAKDNH